MTTTKTQKRAGAGSNPVLPRRTTTAASQDALARIRRFHLSGPAAAGSDGPLPELVPLLLHRFAEPDKVRTDYPLYLPPPAGEPDEPLCLSLADFLAAAAAARPGARMLQDNLARLERGVREAIAREDRPQDARPALAEAVKGMLAELKLGPDDRARLAADAEALAAAVPEGARFVPFTQEAPLVLFEQAVRSRVLPRRAALARETALLAEKLRALVAGDRRSLAESTDPTALGESLGMGGELIDAGALAGVLGPKRGTSAIREDRRARLESALAVLEGAARSLRHTLATVVHDNALGEIRTDAHAGLRLVTDDDPCAAAECLFDEQAEELAQTLRAVRTARLELEGRFDPARHEPWLREFTWEAFSREECALLLPIAAVMRDDTLTHRPLQSLSRLLLSGRPVHVMVVTQPAHNPGADEDPLAGGFRLEPGFLGLSHREALVQETSAARPAHLIAGFLAGLGSTRTTLTVLATGLRADGREPRIGAWLYSGAALEGRAHPFFRYDPEAGRGFGRRFSLEGNPQPEEDWPLYTLTIAREGAGEETLATAFTFADFALLEPALAGHFRVVPEDVAETELLAVPEYLALAPEEAGAKIPYVWAVDAASTVRRVAVSRRLALAARDRLGYWRTLEEFAGIRSDHVAEATARAKAEFEARLAAARSEMEAEKAEEVERVRRAANEEVANRLTAALLDVDPASLPTSGGGLAGLRGKSADRIAAELMGLLATADLDRATEHPGDARVDGMASELMKLIDPEDL